MTVFKSFLLVFLIHTITYAQVVFDEVDVDNIKIDGNTISTTNTNGHLVISPNGTGKLELPTLGASTVPYLDSDKRLTSSLVTPSELGRLSGISSALCGVDDVCELINKTIDGDLNTLKDMPITALKTDAGAADTFISRDNLGAVVSTKSVPSGDVVGTTDIQTLENKSLESPVIEDFISFIEQSSTPSTPGAGYKLLYPKTDGKLYTLDSAGQEVEVGTGSGGGGTGGINHIGNGDAETDTTGWSLFADSAAAAPTDGTGGTSSLTFDRTTTAGQVLRGEGSFKLSKGAANEQGEGVSFDFTVELADYNPPKIQTISFDYKTSSAFGYGAGTAASPSDLVVYIYAKDSGTLIQPTNFTLDGSGKYIGQFQPLSTDDDYRLILHVATTNASAWDFYFDSVSVGPQNTSRGPPVTDWISYTPTVSGLGSGSATAHAKWRQVGDSMEISFRIVKDGTNGTGSSVVSLSLPSGHSLDSAKLPNSDSTTRGAAASTISSSGVLAAVGDVSTGGISFYRPGNTAVVGSDVASGSIIHGSVVVPIAGWGSNLVTTAHDDGRLVSATASVNGTVTLSTSRSAVLVDAVVEDTHGGFNTSTGTYTIPVSGTYKITWNVSSDATTAERNLVAGIILNTTLGSYSNGIASITGGTLVAGDVFNSKPTTSSSARITTMAIAEREFKAGDKINFTAQAVGSAFTVATGNGSMVTIQRVGSPRTLGASETVVVRATSSSGQSFSDNTGAIIVYGTETADSHGAYNSSSGVFTMPYPGKYLVTCSIGWATTNNFASGVMSIRKNAAGWKTRLINAHSSEMATRTWDVTGIVTGVAGDTIDCAANQDQTSGSSRSLEASAVYNTISIFRIGL